MFRIKTDVRQYKCESRDKVVRLIRNWVIRPTDEIYNEQEEVWEPIGEHEAFTATFREMEKAEEGVAETVVSPEIEEDGEGDDEERPAEQTDVDETAKSTDEVVVGETSEPDEVTAVTQAESEVDEVGSEGSGDQDAAPEPPTAPEGVTQGREYADSDEITVMTEETLDTVLEEDEEGGDIDVANEQSAEPRDDLQADVASGQAETEDDEQPETTEPEGRPAQQLESGDQAADGTSIQTNGAANQSGDSTTETTDSGESDGESGAVTSREDLPEEVFATNRIERDTDEGEAASSSQEGATTPASDGSDEEEWDEILQRLRDTDELDGEEIDQIEESRDDLAIGRDEPAEDETTDQTEDYYGASGGYDWELPGYVAPTPADREHGLQAKSVSESEKGQVFPYPGPKQKGHVQTRTFELGEAADEETEKSGLQGLDNVVRVVAIVFVVLVILAMLWSL